MAWVAPVLTAILTGYLADRFALFALANAVTFLLARILVTIGYREFARAEISVNGSPEGKLGGPAFSLHATLGDSRRFVFLALMVGFGCLVNLLGAALQPLLSLGLIFHAQGLVGKLRHDASRRQRHLALVIFLTGLTGMNAKDPTPEMGQRQKSG